MAIENVGAANTRVKNEVLHLVAAESGILTRPDGSELRIPENAVWQISATVVSLSHAPSTKGHNSETIWARISRGAGSAAVESASISGPAGLITVTVSGSDVVRIAVDGDPPSPVDFDWVADVRITEVGHS